MTADSRIVTGNFFQQKAMGDLTMTPTGASTSQTLKAMLSPVAGGTTALTLASGLVSTGRFRYLTVPVGGAAYASTGTDTTLVAGTIYWADIVVPRNFTATGIGILNGGTVGTDKGLVGLYSTTGTLLANSATAGATTTGANAFQQYAFTSTYACVGPARFWLAYQQNGTTATIRTVAASTFADVLTKSGTGAFGTLTALTVPTTFTADVGPIAYLY